MSFHRAGFRLFWRWCSRGAIGLPALSAEVHSLIRRTKRESPRCGAPRIQGELVHLGFEESQASVSRFLKRLRP